jgi:branched-chain amino acid transport system ATP-binding protein
MNNETYVIPGEPRDGARGGARLEVEGVSVRFGGLTALDDVSFEVPAGSVVGVIGPNGAGKTTLFNVVCGFTRPQEGTLRLDGKPLRPAPQRLTRHGISRTLQGLGLFPGLDVLENVMAGAQHTTGFVSGLLALPRSDRDESVLRERATDLLEELGLGAFTHAAPMTLPYAVSKRVALARALISEPRLLLLDEPAGGLGHEDIDELGELIASLPTRGSGCSVMLVEHHVDLVMGVCDAIVVLDFGKLIAAGTPDEVRDDPQVAEAYLGAEVAS